MTRQSTPTTDEMHTIPTLEDILRAKDVLNGFVRKTPLQRSDTFSKITGTNIFLKLESLQKTGSFKVRGALNKVSTLSEQQRKYGVIAASAGNHAQGVAYAAARNNISCTIIMPQNASPAKVSATKSYGAKVVLQGSDYDESWIAAKEIAKKEGPTI